MKLIKCDYCSAETRESQDKSFPLCVYPVGWGTVSIKGEEPKDICPACDKKLR